MKILARGMVEISGLDNQLMFRKIKGGKSDLEKRK